MDMFGVYFEALDKATNPQKYENENEIRTVNPEKGPRVIETREMVIQNGAMFYKYQKRHLTIVDDEIWKLWFHQDFPDILRDFGVYEFSAYTLPLQFALVKQNPWRALYLTSLFIVEHAANQMEERFIDYITVGNHVHVSVQILNESFRDVNVCCNVATFGREFIDVTTMSLLSIYGMAQDPPNTQASILEILMYADANYSRNSNTSYRTWVGSLVDDVMQNYDEIGEGEEIHDYAIKKLVKAYMSLWMQSVWTNHWRTGLQSNALSAARKRVISRIGVTTVTDLKFALHKPFNQTTLQNTIAESVEALKHLFG